MSSAQHIALTLGQQLRYLVLGGGHFYRALRNGPMNQNRDVHQR